MTLEQNDLAKTCRWNEVPAGSAVQHIAIMEWTVDMRGHTKYIQLVSGCTKTQLFFPAETFSV